MKDTQHHNHHLSQEPKLNFDSPGTPSHKSPKNKPATKKNKNLHSGMDLLELDFLLSIIENTDGNDQNDLTMRKLNFKEVVKRKKLSQVKSRTLTIYGIDQGDRYGKDIQCKAMQELAKRTSQMKKAIS